MAIVKKTGNIPPKYSYLTLQYVFVQDSQTDEP